MNFIAIIILSTIIISYALNLLADCLNLAKLQPTLPEEFKELYDSDRYGKSQEYLYVNTRFGWIASTAGLILILIFWFGKGFPILDDWVRAFGLNTIWSGLIYMGILVLCRAILSLPLSIYKTFVIEERFGFNKTSPATFVTDLLKGLVLALLLGGPLLSGILLFFQYAGANAWWYCWIAVTLFMLVVQFVAPTWIMPLFNKFTPIEEGELKEGILSYARSIHFPLDNVYVMDGSKRSSKANAFFTGFGNRRRIVLFDTLISQHTVPELVAVLAHEMGHYKKKHIIKTMIIGIAQMGVVFYLLSLFIDNQTLFDAFYMEQKSVYAGLIFFGLLYSPIDFFTGIFMQFYSRKNEYEADRFAVETTNDKISLSDSLKKLSVGNLSNLTPHPFYVFLNYSHPPVLNRIRAMQTVMGI
ncbi:MAG: M48 family metallopeptidase [Deltaproteobacteria bacterium]|nr:M48 family metallopeptidase [Deltaproteobacteria bacterium]